VTERVFERVFHANAFDVASMAAEQMKESESGGDEPCDHDSSHQEHEQIDTRRI
jgi:hypothetical protein